MAESKTTRPTVTRLSSTIDEVKEDISSVKTQVEKNISDISINTETIKLLSTEIEENQKAFDDYKKKTKRDMILNSVATILLAISVLILYSLK